MRGHIVAYQSLDMLDVLVLFFQAKNIFSKDSRYLTILPEMQCPY